jgi:hypothetical protein
MFNQECMCWVPMVIFYIVHMFYVCKDNHFTHDTKIIVLNIG